MKESDFSINNTFAFLDHEMFDLNEEQQEKYNVMLKNGGEIVDKDHLIDK